ECKHKEQLYYEGIQFPVLIKDISKIERSNAIRLNVYVIYCTHKKHNKESHYVWIKDFNTLMNTQSRSHNPQFFCFIFANTASSTSQKKEYSKLIQIYKWCAKDEKLSTPGKNELRFENYHNQLMAPFVIFADFVAIVEPANKQSGNLTTAYQNHIACGYGCKISLYLFSKPVKVYRGLNSIYRFIQNIKPHLVIFLKRSTNNQTMGVTSTDQLQITVMPQGYTEYMRTMFVIDRID
ncbi:hypothetical protein MAR_017383, partial [Mya arenaria]